MLFRSETLRLFISACPATRAPVFAAAWPDAFDARWPQRVVKIDPDQRKAMGYALDDAAKAVGALNRLLGADVPTAYTAAKKKWAAPVKPVAVPAGGAPAP